MTLANLYPIIRASPACVSETRVQVFRRFFEAIVEQCQQAGLVWGRELYLDGTQVNANADLDSLTPRFAVEARETMQAHLAALFSEEESQPEPQTTATEVGATPPEATSAVVMTCTVPSPLPVVLSEAEQEELAAQNAARLDRAGRSKTSGGAWSLPADGGLQSQHH